MEGDSRPKEGDSPPMEGDSRRKVGGSTPEQGDFLPAEGDSCSREGVRLRREGGTIPFEGEGARREGDSPSLVPPTSPQFGAVAAAVGAFVAPFFTFVFGRVNACRVPLPATNTGTEGFVSCARSKAVIA